VPQHRYARPVRLAQHAVNLARASEEHRTVTECARCAQAYLVEELPETSGTKEPKVNTIGARPSFRKAASRGSSRTTRRTGRCKEGEADDVEILRLVRLRRREERGQEAENPTGAGLCYSCRRVSSAVRQVGRPWSRELSASA
jgi:hypothetical protein